jgi:hypothetical protein
MPQDTNPQSEIHDWKPTTNTMAGWKCAKCGVIAFSPHPLSIYGCVPQAEQPSLRDIYERCDVSNNRTDNPLTFDEFQQAIRELITSAKPEKRKTIGPMNQLDRIENITFNQAIDSYEAALLQKLEGDTNAN